jgi:ribosomal protein L44E
MNPELFYTAKTNFTVVRNEGNMRSSFTTGERHSERKNEAYGNGDVVVKLLI